MSSVFKANSHSQSRDHLVRATNCGSVSSLNVFKVTNTVAPVSARMAGQRPVRPMIVVAINTAFSPSAIVMFWRMLPKARLGEVKNRIASRAVLKAELALMIHGCSHGKVE